MIKREYKTKCECVELMVEEDFNAINVHEFLDAEEIYQKFYFYSTYPEDDEEIEDMEWYDASIPMWNTWWVPSNGFIREWIEKHDKEVADCGFTMIHLAEWDDFYALGVDGCGYSFADTHFRRLYELQNLHWHDEEDTEGEED